MLAVVIPFFKLQFFKETLDSLASQTNKNFNVYIGNDASPKNPKVLINDYRNVLNITYVEFEKNLGLKSLTGQWDRCINLTKVEEWIMLLGDDDYLSDNYIQEFYYHLEEIESMNVKVVKFSTIIVREDKEGEHSRKFTHPKIEKSTDAFYRRFFKQSRGSLSEQIFKKEVYLKKGFKDFPLAWGSDNLAWLEFTEFGNIFTINTATAYFRISDKNISRNGFEEEKKAEAKFQYFSLIVDEYLDKFSPFQKFKILKLYEVHAFRAKKIDRKFYLKMISKYLKAGHFFQLLKFPRRLFLIYPQNK